VKTPGAPGRRADRAGGAGRGRLPIERKDEDMNVIMRLYAPDLERFEAWTPPQAEKVEGGSR